jgi:hypothetical protein
MDATGDKFKDKKITFEINLRLLSEVMLDFEVLEFTIA